MSEEIPKGIIDNFTISNNNIKYPTYPDEDFQKSISDDPELANYSEENMKKAFNDFFVTFNNCKNATYEIIAKKLT